MPKNAECENGHPRRSSDPKIQSGKMDHPSRSSAQKIQSGKNGHPKPSLFADIMEPFDEKLKQSRDLKIKLAKKAGLSDKATAKATGIPKTTVIRSQAEGCPKIQSGKTGTPTPSLFADTGSVWQKNPEWKNLPPPLPLPRLGQKRRVRKRPTPLLSGQKLQTAKNDRPLA